MLFDTRHRTDSVFAARGAVRLGHVLLMAALPLGCSLQSFDDLQSGGAGGDPGGGTAGLTFMEAGTSGSVNQGGASAGGSTGEWVPLPLEPAPEGALFADPSFEEGFAGWVPVGTVLLSQSDDRPRSGTYMLHVGNRTASWMGAGFEMRNLARPGYRYLVSAWLRAEGDTRHHLTLRHTCVGAATQYVRIVSGNVGRDWTRFEGVLAIPNCAAISDLTVFLESDEPSDLYDFDIDDVIIVQDPAFVPPDPVESADAGADPDAGDGGSEASPDSSVN